MKEPEEPEGLRVHRVFFFIYLTVILVQLSFIYDY